MIEFEKNEKTIFSIITNSNLFDKTYYLKEYHDVRIADIKPLEHYVKFGIKEDRKPNKDFDPVWYKNYYSEITKHNIYPFIHFILFGNAENRFRNELEKIQYDELVNNGFDIQYYKNNNEDLKIITDKNFDFILHYIRFGQFENRIINSKSNEIVNKNLINLEKKGMVHKKFSNSFNIEIYPFSQSFLENELSLVDFFDEKYYLDNNIDVKNAGINPLEHFMYFGHFEKRNPNENFDINYYLINNVDCYIKNMNPIEHYLTYRNNSHINTKSNLEFSNIEKEQSIVFVIKDLNFNFLNINLLEKIRTFNDNGYEVKIITYYDGHFKSYLDKYTEILILETLEYKLDDSNENHQDFIKLFVGYNVKILYFYNIFNTNISSIIEKNNNLKKIYTIDMKLIQEYKLQLTEEFQTNTEFIFTNSDEIFNIIDNNAIHKDNIIYENIHDSNYLDQLKINILKVVKSLNKKQKKESAITSWLNNNLKANNNFKVDEKNLYIENNINTMVNKFKELLVNKKVVSFDIFDTLLERTVINPHSVFTIIENDAKCEKNIDIDFKLFRIESELEARKNSNFEEITLDEIYEVLQYKYNISEDICNYLKEQELMQEKNVLKVKESGKKIFEIAKKHDIEIVLISDMYLSKDFIFDLLEYNEIYIDKSNLFVSCEERKTKHSGNLFTLVKKIKKIQDSEWLHVGDNLHSDINIPMKMGIQTFFVQNSSNSLKNVYQNSLIDLNILDNNIQASTIYGTIANKFYFDNKISLYNGNPIRIGFETLGIVFLGFLNYIKSYLKNNSYDKVFFVSRDGYYLKLIYDELLKYDSSFPKSYYLLSSRLLTYSASLIDEESISYVANKDYFPTTLKHLLNVRFNFNEDMLSKTEISLKDFGFNNFEDRVIQHENHENYVNFVLFHQNLIIEKNKNNKKNFKEYIDSLNINENSLIVDIGYAGSLQKTLLTLTGKKIDGLYFIVNEKIKELSTYGLNFDSYINYNNKYVEKFFKYVQMFELLFSATHPSVIGIENNNDKFSPIFDSATFTEKTNKILALIHYGAIDFIKKYLSNHFDIFNNTDKYDEDLMLQNIFNLFENPSKEDSKLFDEIIFEDNFGANKYSLITKDLEKLSWDDDILLRHGIWAQASKRLINEPKNIIINSTNYTDKLSEDFEVLPYFNDKDFNNLYLNGSAEKIYPFFMIVIKLTEEFLVTFIESIKKQFYPFFSVLFVFDKEISIQSQELIIYSVGMNYVVDKINNDILMNEKWIINIEKAVILEPNFLAEVYQHIVENDSNVIYCDDDDYFNSEYINPKFKPNFSPELMLSQPYYTGSVLCFNSEIYKNIQTDFLNSRILFQSIIKNINVGHIPKILFHNLTNFERKDYSFLIKEYLDEIKLPYKKVYEQDFSKESNFPVYSIKFPNEGPDVAIIIPTKNKLDVLKVALDSLEITSYKNYRVYIIDNDSDEEDILNFFKTTKHTILKISSINGKFSYSYVNNEAAKIVDEEFILFLNNDIKVLEKNWLSQMIGLMQIKNIGQVGARLYYENDMLQHVGITNHVAAYGLPAPSFKLIEGTSSGYLNYAKSIKNFSAMTAACMLTKKDLFFEMGGFDDEDFSVAYNDCDYGFKLTQAGFRNVVAPNAELYHYEGVTRGIGVGNDKPSEESSFIRKYKNWKDPYYNQNLTQENTNFSVRNTIVRTSSNQRFRCLMVTHNYEYEGAPLIQFEIAKGLKENYDLDIVVISPIDGPLREEYEKYHIKTYVLDSFNLFSSISISEYEKNLFEIKKQIVEIGADIIFANTILNYWAIEIANEFSIPSLWTIHESEPPFEHLREHSKLIESRGKLSINYTYKNIFVAHATKELFEKFNLKNNFEVIHNGFDTSRVSIKIDEETRLNMRKELSIEDKFVFICPGIVSERKSQIDAIKALELLPSEIRKDIVVLIVGDRVSSYSDEMHLYHQNSDDITKENVKIIKETKEIGRYYNASDAFLFTSHLESFPKVIQEAMYLKLPIVSTNTFGIKEQVFHNSSALLCDIGDIKSLSENMKNVFENKELREKLVENALSALDKLPTYDEMVQKYNELMQQAFLMKE